MPGAQRTIIRFLAEAAARRPHHVAVEDLPAGRCTYAELDALSDAVRDRLRRMGVRRGDRVGICLHKSIDSYAALLGAMKAGAAYVPVDPTAPSWRLAFILHDCAVRAVVIELDLLSAWRVEAEKLGGLAPAVLALDAVGGGATLHEALASANERDPAPAVPSEALDADDLAYILYTSGSTGRPKGVMLTHRSAVSFVDWCSDTFEPRADDRFSSHAPFHFDLSILDLYVPLKHGAMVVLIDAEAGKEPQGLAKLIADRGLTVWYSTPTILTLLAQYGRMESRDYHALRLVLFAGEVFPIKHLRALKARLPHPMYFNLYGPTETNVCTYHRIPDVVPETRAAPYPIGRTCSHLRSRVVDPDGVDVSIGDEGELIIAGPAVMAGYWNVPERTAQAFLLDPEGTRWYRTGDIVVSDDAGEYSFVGRRDRMVKRRGYRIELGEIEAGLYRHEAVEEAAVVSSPDADGGVRITAFLSCAAGRAPSFIEMKTFCAQVLPAYMVPDAFAFLPALPKTSTGKMDFQALVGRL